MPRKLLTIIMAALITMGTLAEIKVAQARRGADDSQEHQDGRRGRGRGQDDSLELRGRREGRRGQHHLQGEGHRRGRGHTGNQGRTVPDDSTGRDGGRGRGQDDR